MEETGTLYIAENRSSITQSIRKRQVLWNRYQFLKSSIKLVAQYGDRTRKVISDDSPLDFKRMAGKRCETATVHQTLAVFSSTHVDNHIWMSGIVECLSREPAPTKLQQNIENDQSAANSTNSWTWIDSSFLITKGAHKSLAMISAY